MKRNSIKTGKAAIYVLASCIALNLSSQVTYCPASPDAVSVTQPDGSIITVVGKGNSVVNYTETTDGYSLIKNSQGFYEYAVQDANGNLARTNIIAHSENNRSAQELKAIARLEKHARMNNTLTQELVRKALESGNSKTSAANRKAAGISYFPNKGKQNVLLILIEYPDLKHKDADSVKSFSNLMNQVNYKGTGSFRDYYLANSTNQLDLNTDVFGWYMAPQPYKTYGRNAGGDNAAAALIRAAIDSAYKAGVDFSKYDNDSNGRIESVVVVHAGPGAEVGSQTDYIWSHRGGLSRQGLGISYNNVSLDGYAVQPETYLGGMSGIGVFCHEFGHVLGLPDLYDIDYSSQGVGNWSIMAGGPYLNNTNSPAGHDAWCKIDMGWNTPVYLDINKGGIDSLHAANGCQEVFKIKTPVSSEYFLLENRQNRGFDRYLPGHGMAIWHIDSLKASAFRKSGNNSVNATDTHRGVEIMQADGKNDLRGTTSQGDPGDLFPYKAQYTVFCDTTNPAAATYGKAPGATTTNSGIVVENIVEKGGVIYFGYKKAEPTQVSAISKQGTLSVSIYPNPAKERVFINIEATNAIAELVDISGRAVIKTLLSSGKNEINTSELGKGIYILKLSTPDGNSRMEKISLF